MAETTLEEIEALSEHPEIQELLMEAAALYVAAESDVPADVDKLAGNLRALLVQLPYEESLHVATDLLSKYGSDSAAVEADFPVGIKRPRSGPNPKLNDQYAPGKAEWWEP